jgi:hypothetical protein
VLLATVEFNAVTLDPKLETDPVAVLTRVVKFELLAFNAESVVLMVPIAVEFAVVLEDMLPRFEFMAIKLFYNEEIVTP